MMRFSNGYACYRMKCNIGDEFTATTYHSNKVKFCRFIKVTAKGFNFLNLETHRTLFTKPFYEQGMAGKNYPSKGNITVNITIPSYLILRKAVKESHK